MLVLIQWMIIIAAAWAFGRLGKKFGQPLAVGEIAAGIFLARPRSDLIWPARLAGAVPARETQKSLQLLGKLGLIFLLFQVGMEFDYSHLRSRSRTVTAVSILGIAAPFLCGLAIAPWLHEKFAPDTPRFGFQLFLCIALSISALPIMGRILLEMKLERTVIGAMGISAAAIDDVIGWILLGVATALVTAGFQRRASAAATCGHRRIFSAAAKNRRPVAAETVAQKHRRRARKRHAQFLSRAAAHRACSPAASSRINSASSSSSARFCLARACIRKPALVKAWRDRFSGVVLVAFVPIFFTNTGLNTKIGSLQTPEAWLACALVLAAAVAGKLGGCYLGARLTGQPPREAGCIAALMNTRALMALIAINIGLDLGLLTPALFTMLVIMALLTTAMCGPLLRWWLPKDLRKLVPD